MSQLRTLLVDDNDTFLNSVSIFLSSYPELEVVGLARSGVEAIEKSEALHPQLVLIDAVMPGMNGLDATRIIKGKSKAPRVVIWTLHTDSQYETAAAAAGADGFLPKSALAKRLLPLIHTLFGLPEPSI
jgi:DNA-binding NarL/FixJ family response regulator